MVEKIKFKKQYKPIGFGDRDDRGSVEAHLGSVVLEAEEEVTDYDDGFKAGFNGRPNDYTKSQAWQRGWAEAQE